MGLETGKTLMFQFNPEKVEGSFASTTWAEIKVAGREFPYLHYGHGDVHHINIELHFGYVQTNLGFVAGQLEALASFTEPVIQMQGMQRPEKVMLVLGSYLRKQCIVKSVAPRTEKTYDRWTLLPHRGIATVVLWEYKE